MFFVFFLFTNFSYESFIYLSVSYLILSYLGKLKVIIVCQMFLHVFSPSCKLSQFLLQALGSGQMQETEVSSLNHAARWHFGSMPCRVLSKDF